MLKPFDENFDFLLLVGKLFAAQEHVVQTNVNVLVNNLVFLWVKEFSNLWNNKVGLRSIVSDQYPTDRLVGEDFLECFDVLLVDTTVIRLCTASYQQNNLLHRACDSHINTAHFNLGVNVLQNWVAHWDSERFVVLLLVENDFDLLSVKRDIDAANTSTNLVLSEFRKGIEHFNIFLSLQVTQTRDFVFGQNLVVDAVREVCRSKHIDVSRIQDNVASRHLHWFNDQSDITILVRSLVQWVKITSLVLRVSGRIAHVVLWCAHWLILFHDRILARGCQALNDFLNVTRFYFRIKAIDKDIAASIILTEKLVLQIPNTDLVEKGFKERPRLLVSTLPKNFINRKFSHQINNVPEQSEVPVAFLTKDNGITNINCGS